jgi:hypothetical protein
MAHTAVALRIGHPGQHRQQARRIPGNLVCQLNEAANRGVNTARHGAGMVPRGAIRLVWYSP